MGDAMVTSHSKAGLVAATEAIPGTHRASHSTKEQLDSTDEDTTDDDTADDDTADETMPTSHHAMQDDDEQPSTATRNKEFDMAASEVIETGHAMGNDQSDTVTATA